MAKSRFLRVGWSAWELKIDTKRFKYKKNSHFEYDIERIRATNKQIRPSEGHNKKLKMHVFTITRVSRGSGRGVFTIIRVLHGMDGVSRRRRGIIIVII